MGITDSRGRVRPGVTNQVIRVDPVVVVCRRCGQTSIGISIDGPAEAKSGGGSRGEGRIGGALQREASVGRNRWLRPVESRSVRRGANLSYSVGGHCRGVRSNGHDHGAHHVVLFVAKNMAMPDVFPSEIDHVVDNRGRVIGRILVGIFRSGTVTNRMSRIERTNTIRDIERQGCLLHGTQGHNDVFERVHPNGVFTAEFVVVRQFNLAVPTNAVDDLNVEQVEVDEVRIHTVVRDLPDLGFAILEDFGWWIVITVGNGCLGEEVRKRKFHTESCVHTAVVSGKEFLNGLRLHGNSTRSCQ